MAVSSQAHGVHDDTILATIGRLLQDQTDDEEDDESSTKVAHIVLYMALFASCCIIPMGCELLRRLCVSFKLARRRRREPAAATPRHETEQERREQTRLQEAVYRGQVAALVGWQVRDQEQPSIRNEASCRAKSELHNRVLEEILSSGILLEGDKARVGDGSCPICLQHFCKSFISLTCKLVIVVH